MNSEIKATWLKALRSGTYPQSRGALRDTRGYCCLGVLCDVINPVTWSCQGEFYLWYSGSRGVVAEFSPLESVQLGIAIHQDALITMNDRGSSFHEIANFIEKNL